MNTTRITIAGNCGDDPEIRRANGKTTARMRVAVADRFQDATGAWVDGPTSWHTVVAWGPLAERIAETVHKGNRVLLCGRIAQREWSTETGERRVAWEITAEDLGLSLRHASAAIAGSGRISVAQA